MRVVEIHDKGEIIYDHQYQLHDKRDALADLAKYLGMSDLRLVPQDRAHARSGIDLSNVPDEVLEKWIGELASYQDMKGVGSTALSGRRA
jgi:hypothetical protein